MGTGKSAGAYLGVLTVVLVAAGACTTFEVARPTSTPSPSTPAPAASTGATPGVLRPTSTPACRVTTPNGSTPPGEAPDQRNHGNGKIWTVLWPDGKVIVRDRGWIQPDGRIAMKWPWWRALDAAGPLTVTGRRLDAPAAPLEAMIPSGYGQAGFQATGLIFSTPGCWEVTGHAGGYALTFVTEVVLAPELTGQGSGAGTRP